MTYSEFLKRKRIIDVPTGFEPRMELLPSSLFDFQRDCVSWGCRRGRAAFFEDCGLGKTRQSLAWAVQVVEKTGGNVLIVAPLCVASQTVREGNAVGINVHYVRDQSEVQKGVNITNYEKLHKFDASKFAGVALDESSILKSYDGKTRTAIIEAFARTPFKSAWTATPAPNDYMELGNHAEFLGVMSRTEMLATFFVHDAGETSKWRLKGHAEAEFWKWLCSWAVNIRKPSDLGYEDRAFTLPKLHMIEHIVESNQSMEGYLFPLPASTLDERRKAQRASLGERVAMAAELATGNQDQWVFWCNLNDESAALTKAIGAQEIAGATSEEERERITLGFQDGTIRRVVTKGSLWGFGLNLQCCHNTAFVGLSDSYERFYQMVRRFWRFCQTSEVNAHIITSANEGAVLQNIKRKEKDASRMSEEMVRHMADISSAEIKGSHRETIDYNPTKKMTLPKWLKAA